MTIRFQVPDASCGHCKSTIESAVTSLDDVSAADLDLSSKRLTVEGSASPDAVSRAIVDAGYTAQEVA